MTRSFTLKQNPITRADLDDLVDCYKPEERHQRVEAERFKKYTYDELIERDKVSLDVFLLRDESLAGTENLPAPVSSPPRSSKTSKLPSKNSGPSPRISKA